MLPCNYRVDGASLCSFDFLPIFSGEEDAVNSKNIGTKVGSYYKISIPAGETVVLKSRLFSSSDIQSLPFKTEFDSIFSERMAEADTFYENASS